MPSLLLWVVASSFYLRISASLKEDMGVCSAHSWAKSNRALPTSWQTDSLFWSWVVRLNWTLARLYGNLTGVTLEMCCPLWAGILRPEHWFPGGRRIDVLWMILVASAIFSSVLILLYWQHQYNLNQRIFEIPKRTKFSSTFKNFIKASGLWMNNKSWGKVRGTLNWNSCN